MRNEWDWAIEDINNLFIQNGMENNMIHNFFKQCINDKTMYAFYIDDRVKFNGRRKLSKLLKVLREYGF